MTSKLKKLFVIINKLDKKNLVLFLRLSAYQSFVISRLMSKKTLSAKEVLSSPLRLSKAQKYRYIRDLLNKNFIKKTYNQYFIK
jgi:predicted transcriptional regulator